MDLTELIAQLQQYGPWGWAIAAVLVIFTSLRKKTGTATAPDRVGTPATATRPAAVVPTDAEVLAQRHAAAAADVEAERQRLQSELAKLRGLSGPPAAASPA